MRELKRNSLLRSFFKKILLYVLPCSIIVIASLSYAQSINIDFGGQSGSTTARLIQIIGITTVLAIAPGVLIMVTSFTRIIVVLAILRHALATQSSPPNMVLSSLAMFMTFFIMAPVFQESWNTGIVPLMEEKIEESEAYERAVLPFHTFMLGQVRDEDLKLFLDVSNFKPKETNEFPSFPVPGEEEKSSRPENPEEVSMIVLIPAFMLSELRRAFEIGFLIFVPFIVIDMIIASILMSMGMMMLPPIVVSMPIKIVFFVLIDGWRLIVGTLLNSFNL